MVWALIFISGVSLAAWLVLVFARGGFWKADILLATSDWASDADADWPATSIVLPARNEAAVLPRTLPSLLSQDYPKPIDIFLVDDQSDDGTPDEGVNIRERSVSHHQLKVVRGEPTPSGWAGKVWAMHQGAQEALSLDPKYVLFTDADITFAPSSARELVDAAESGSFDLVSVMARLRTSGLLESLLVPAFVYFFAMLFPFRWVNRQDKPTAAAAGGCMLVRTSSFRSTGGLERIADRIIDDCALASVIKSGGGRLRLGFSDDIQSVREYRGLAGIWRVVARTAFAQLNYSRVALAGTTVGMLVVFASPPITAALGLFMASATGGLWWLAAVMGLVSWGLMAASQVPMLLRYAVPAPTAALMPVSGILYSLMTLHSAVRYWQGRGGSWKGRTYPLRRAAEGTAREADS